jgi:hypothetical protein
LNEANARPKDESLLRSPPTEAIKQGIVPSSAPLVSHQPPANGTKHSVAKSHLTIEKIATRNSRVLLR